MVSTEAPPWTKSLRLGLLELLLCNPPSAAHRAAAVLQKLTDGLCKALEAYCQ